MVRRVLVVDDSMMVREEVGSTLAAAGYSVVEAEDGAKALEALPKYPDLALIFLDLNMPNMDGLEFLRRMRGGGSTVPVLMLTTEGQPRLMQEAKALGAKGWIIKPFKADMLIAAARKVAPDVVRPASV